jgi:hypothetical protein
LEKEPNPDLHLPFEDVPFEDQQGEEPERNSVLTNRQSAKLRASVVLQ